MRKAVFLTHNLGAGGTERVIVELVKYFSTKGIECSIIRLNKREVIYSLPKEIELISLPNKFNNNVINKLWKYKEFRKSIRYIKPDVVLAMPEEIGIYAIPALIGLNTPIVVSERNNPWVMPWKKETRLFRKLFYPLASGFIFQTDQAASFFSSRIQRKGRVIPNPLDLQRIPDIWEGPRRKEIVGVGRLDKQKNFSLLIRSFSKFYTRYPEYTLTIFGKGPLRQQLINLASSLLPENAYKFPGETSDLLNSIRGASMFILSSDYEGMPNVLIEAMAMGMPVVSTDCPSGGPAELIQDGVNGLLVPIGDVDAMSDAMSQLTASEEFRASLGKNAQDIRKLLDSTIVSEQWRVYLDEVSKKKNTD